ncbi:MAG TPA: LysR substrate-binding domain-containing protein [Anaerolineales bacterium]|nr:LysR substrate-binding domain-containing protein [Anaerolineales bacterium]
MIDFRKVEIFLYAAETASLSEVAKQLHVSQPAVSYQIRSLEQELGVTLFTRRSNGLRLTEAGRLMLPWARRLLHDTNDLRKMMTSLQEDVAGELRVACSTTAGKYILPQIAARFTLRYPAIMVRIFACGPENAALRLLDGEAHLCVVSTEVSDPSLEAQEFFGDTITLIVPADHRWALRKRIRPEEILEEKVIMREETSGTRRVVLTELAKHDISLEDLNVSLELGNAEAIVRTVAAGYGVSFVSTLATACPLERGNVVDIAVEGLALYRKVYMVRQRLSDPPRPRDAFWSFIHDPSNADILRLAQQPGEKA